MHTKDSNGKEYILDDTEVIVSKTDLHGNITYINQDFIRVCGYTEHELIGTPQNIIRHPDMPKEAFYDLWHTIQSGKAWSGLVKNRCKNGDYYWVEAHVAPTSENGKVTGYTSIRVKPSRQKIQDAAHAYNAINNGDRRITIREGAVVRRPRLSRHPQHAPREFSLRAKLGIWCTGLMVLFLASTMAAWQLHATNTNQATSIPLVMLVLGLLGITVTCVGGIALYRAVIRPLALAQDAIDLMCSGDLSGRITAIGNNEIADLMQSLRKLQINIKLLIGQIKESTLAVDTQMQHLVDGNILLTERTHSQAQNVAQTSAYVAEITTAIQQYAENATSASNLVDSTAQAATRGTDAIAQVTETMNTIQESATKVEDISSLIDEIAFQTNILALNAAVEAAHAGNHGSGFAVVAAEVRRLALRSADAASEIKTLSQDSVSRISDGSQQVARTAEIMDDIVDFAQKASNHMTDIALNSQEQSASIEQINQALTQIENITEDNRDQVVHTAESAKQAYDQTHRLSAQVNEFKLVATDSGQPAAAQIDPPRVPTLLLSH